MYDKNILNSVLLDWASRSSDGLISSYLDEDKQLCLYESLLINGISENDAIDIVNEVGIIFEKGKHPERQAYNKNGILVTFPTPEYKAKAIARGTHFEKNPKTSQSNLFGGGQQAPSAATPTNVSAGNEMDSGNTTLPKSDSSQQQTPPEKKEIPEPGTPGGAVPPAPAPSAASSPAVSSPAQGNLQTEPIPQQQTPPNVSTVPTPPTPPVVQKTPKEIAVEKELIKQILNTDDTLPTVPGVGGSGVTEVLKEQLQKLKTIAIEINFNEAANFLSKHF